MEVNRVQTVQLRRPWAARCGRPSTPAAEGATGVPGDLLRTRVRGDEDEPVRRELLLELRRPVPAPGPPRPRRPRHLLHGQAGGREQPPGRLCGAGQDHARSRWKRLHRVPVRLEDGGGAEEHPAHAHHGHIQQRPMAPRPETVRGEEVLLDRPGVPKREAGRHAPRGVPPDRGHRRRHRPHPRAPQGHHRPVLRQARPPLAALQAGVQPVHRAEHGDLRLPPRVQQVG
mmetsp:Transcript_9308/g.16017  ORF Transcript_9308/g.16017 Transcript_9308/m.16017 type:complete len:229 (+) Transcript_9308:632-1318(+)